MALDPNAPGALGMQQFPAAPVAIVLALILRRLRPGARLSCRRRPRSAAG